MNRDAHLLYIYFLYGVYMVFSELTLPFDSWLHGLVCTILMNIPTKVILVQGSAQQIFAHAVLWGLQISGHTGFLFNNIVNSICVSSLQYSVLHALKSSNDVLK